MIRYRLLQARFPDDPVRAEERAAFASRLGVPGPSVEPFDLLTETIDVERVMDGTDAVLVGGSGAFGVGDDAPWLPDFIDLMGQLADRSFPTFASCFGFQALVVALGGEVRTDEAGSEVGSYEVGLTEHATDDPLFGALPARFVAQQGHKDRATRLPSGVIHLASSERCPYQALRLVDRPVYATQFHAELTRDDNRTRFARYFDMYASAFGHSQAQRMLDDFRDSPHANQLLARFHSLMGDRANA